LDAEGLPPELSLAWGNDYSNTRLALRLLLENKTRRMTGKMAVAEKGIQEQWL
jgi:hypothetical protein